MWIMFLYRIDVGPLSDRYADIPTSYRYLSDMGMLTGTPLASKKTMNICFLVDWACLNFLGDGELGVFHIVDCCFVSGI